MRFDPAAVELAAFFGRVPEVKDAVVGSTIGGLLVGQRGDPVGDLITNQDHLCPNLRHSLHFGLVLLKENNDAIYLLELNLKEGDLAVQGSFRSGSRQVIIEVPDGRFFQCIQIRYLQRHATSLSGGPRKVNGPQGYRSNSHFDNRKAKAAVSAALQRLAPSSNGPSQPAALPTPGVPISRNVSGSRAAFGVRR